jgi:hypothetical protein
MMVRQSEAMSTPVEAEKTMHPFKAGRKGTHPVEHPGGNRGLPEMTPCHSEPKIDERGASTYGRR